MVIATKFAMPMGMTVHDRGGSRRYIMAAVEASLRRLGTDYIDLYQMHAPDPDTPIEETLGALDDVVRQGKVRYIGNSNFSGWQIADADWTARTNHGARSCRRRTTTACSNAASKPMCSAAASASVSACCRSSRSRSGMLTGKYHRNEPPPQGTRLATVAAWRNAR